ncbi:MAG: HisA/HisF-related TIM barrel protein [Pseudorhodobacter sp.]|nr:HisA/HisF-related TIM barrel protein [Pseudorhodobacter sp.]
MASLAPTPGRPLSRPRPRVIPTLLIDAGGRLVKTVKFGKRDYIGDPINAVKIFNNKEVDELVLLDIDASRKGYEPNYNHIEAIVGEAFMPVAYGGGLRTMSHIERAYRTGIEKVILSSSLLDGTELIRSAAARWGVQAITVCLPVGTSLWRKPQVRLAGGKKPFAESAEQAARRVLDAGAGELIVYSIDRDGTFDGFDIDLLSRITSIVDVPVVACGGARDVPDLARAVNEAKCAAVAAGSLFVFRAKGQGVLINYPSPTLLAEAFEKHLKRKPDR